MLDCGIADKYAHVAEGRKDSLISLKDILSKGARSLHFPLQQNTDIAIKNVTLSQNYCKDLQT